MREIDIIYNRFWTPTLRLLYDWSLVTYGGTHVGFVRNNELYNYFGTHVGRLELWVMYDLNWLCVWFGNNPTNIHPLLPLRQLAPLPSLVPIPPIRPITEIPNLSPIKQFSRSKLLPLQLFLNQKK